MQMYPLDASLTLAEAAPKWLEQHARYIKPNTLRNYKACLRILIPFLGKTLLKDLQIDHVRSYQAFREPVKNCVINSEIDILRMIMKECGEWDRIKEFYKPMRVPKRRGGHSISADEERILREVAFSRPKWRLAAHCMTVMFSTTMGFGELRHIRRRDVAEVYHCPRWRQEFLSRPHHSNERCCLQLDVLDPRTLGEIRRKLGIGVYPAPPAACAQGTVVAR
jgi:hypothetical protein